MSQFLTTRVEQAFERQAILGLELIDGVTLDRIYKGIRVKAFGLQSEPRINHSGVFCWVGKRINQSISSIDIDPGERPYEKKSLGPLDLAESGLPPILQIELVPRVDYPFPGGTTGVMGRLVEKIEQTPLVPVPDARMTLQVLINGKWESSRLSGHSNAQGDFAAVLRFVQTGNAGDDPPQSKIKLRLQIQRGTAIRVSHSWDNLLGVFLTPTANAKQVFAWNLMS